MKIAVMGAAGRMGQELVRTIATISAVEIAGGIERPGSQWVGQDIGKVAGLDALGIIITDDPLELIVRAEAILDFTTPAATVETAGLAANARIVHVIGTTGLQDEHMAAIRAASRHATIVQAGNMSLGVNLLLGLTRKIAAALDDDYDIEILEMHHKHKVDAPSGTALMLGEAAAEGRGIKLSERSVRVRDGHTGARKAGDVGFATLRGGSVIGDHSVIFAGSGERIEISHLASDRGIYARGAIKAAQWGRGKGPGLFSMADVLGL
ncbi:MAG: 4-hydroxy-tetrahydrodipicolinate reductase [Hyphomicrobiaceae bacterium]